MAEKERLSELSVLNLLFCCMVLWIHCSGHPVTVLDHGSWQYGLMICLQRLAFVSVSGFFFLSGLKLILSSAPQRLGRYYKKRVKAIFLPYLLAVAVYYGYFMHRGYFGFSLSGLIGYAIRGDLSAPFYFVVALAQFVLLVPLFRWLARRWSPVLLVPAGLAVTVLSGQYFNDVLHLFSPALNFAYSDRVFTTYLIYYLAGCCAGRYYEAFTRLLRENFAFLMVLAGVLAAADVICSWRFFVHGESVPFLETLHMFYQVFAIPALYALALRFPVRLPPLVRRMDRASFLVYLYHALLISWFDEQAARLGITKVSVQFALRVAVVYTLVFALCMLWQAGYGKLRSALRPA